MTNQQLYLVIGIPMLFNATLIGLILGFVNTKFNAINQRFDAIDRRFDDIGIFGGRNSTASRKCSMRG